MSGSADPGDGDQHGTRRIRPPHSTKTLNPKPETLNPTCTLNPKPYMKKQITFKLSKAKKRSILNAAPNDYAWMLLTQKLEVQRASKP